MDKYRSSGMYIPGVNVLIIQILALRFARDKKAVNAYMSQHAESCTQWQDSLPFFFGFSSYRSGTVFLTNILKSEFPDWHIEHEANVDDYWNYPKVMRNEEEASKYFNEFRKAEICCRVGEDKSGVSGYGEVNPFLRLHAGAVKQAFPKAKLFHVVRDGRDVVRSIMSREILNRKDPMNRLIAPPANDPYVEEWDSMSRFEKVCWQWQFDNAAIRKHVKHQLKFEEFRKDYNYFKSELLDYLGLEMDPAHWESYTKKPKNITPKYAIEHWTKWSKSQQGLFERICGDEMQALGYELNW